MKLQNLIILAVACYAAPTSAQDAKQDSTALKRELTLEKEYTPTIRDAAKIGTLPELKEPEAPKTQVEFAKFSVPYEISPQLTTLPAGSFFTDVLHSKKRGYLTAGVSSFIDIDGDLGYQILNSEQDRLSIFGSHRSSNGNVKYLQDDTKQKMKINDNLFGLGYLHDFGGTRLNIDAKYTCSSFNYYGFTIPYVLTDDYSNSSYYIDSWLPDDIHKDVNQVDNIFEIGAGITNDRPNELNYTFSLSNTLFKQKYLYSKELDGTKENRFTAGWDFHQGINPDMNIGLSGYWKNYDNTTPGNKRVFGFYDYNNILLNPYFRIDGDRWNLRLGVKVNMLLMSGIDNKSNLSPDVEFNYHPAEKIDLYLSAGGGVQDNSCYSMFYENRYVTPGIRIFDSRVPLDGKIGVRGSSSGNFRFDVFAGYKVIKDEHFFNTALSLVSAYLDPGAFLAGGMIYPLYADAEVFSLGGELKYNYQDVFELGLKATYYSWDISSDMLSIDPVLLQKIQDKKEPWGKPDFEAELTAGYKIPQLPLRLDAVYHLETGRKALLSASAENMKNMNDLGVSGTYTINDTFSIFAKANNLLFQKYDLFYGYPARDFNIMGGISIRF
ncbi:MAG: TonB-dependent receptor [Dysgonamonadaceae bacterium]|jgi:hypothetical protein|nr:TonB-dependent receptor [Dysgonamonadaceae bacterium]